MGAEFCQRLFTPGAPAGEEGVEATLATPLSEDEYQALLDMLPGSPGPGAYN